MQLQSLFALAFADLACAQYPRVERREPAWSGRHGSYNCPASTITEVSTTTTIVTATVTTTPTPAPICATEADANFVIDSFITLITNTGADFNTTLADELFAPDFQDISDSVNFLEEAPLGSVTFSNRTEFIEVAGTQPPFPNVTTLNYYYTCSEVFWRYRLDSGPMMPYPVQGINIFVLDSNKQVQTIYAEQNSGAFLADVGNPECAANFTISVAPRA